MYQAVLSDRSLHLMQKLARKFSNQIAEFWQKYTLLKYRFCNKIQIPWICYVAILVVFIKFSLNHKLLSTRFYNNKDLMEPVGVALTSHWHKCHAVPFEIEADWLIEEGLIPKQVLTGGCCCLHRSIWILEYVSIWSQAIWLIWFAATSMICR